MNEDLKQLIFAIDMLAEQVEEMTNYKIDLQPTYEIARRIEKELTMAQKLKRVIEIKEHSKLSEGQRYYIRVSPFQRFNDNELIEIKGWLNE